MEEPELKHSLEKSLPIITGIVEAANNMPWKCGTLFLEIKVFKGILVGAKMERPPVPEIKSHIKV